MRISTVIILILIFLTTLAYANFIFSDYSATPSTNSVIIDWITKSESGVANFIILRSSDDEIFGEIETIPSKGIGTNYTFIDSDVFKDSQAFFYKLRAVRSDGTLIEETESLIAHPNISGIYRTWGAIKAMFQ